MVAPCVVVRCRPRAIRLLGSAAITHASNVGPRCNSAACAGLSSAGRQHSRGMWGDSGTRALIGCPMLAAFDFHGLLSACARQMPNPEDEAAAVYSRSSALCPTIDWHRRCIAHIL